MKLSRVIVAVTFLGIFAMATHVSIDSDTWWHLRAGQYMVENQKLITQDVFSYTSFGKPWQYPGLWVQIFMYLIFELFGPGGLNIWTSLMITAIFGLVWITTESNVLLRAAILLLSAAASATYWSARPYLFTYLLFAIFFYFLERYARLGEGKLWILPVLMVVWVNTHGGFLAGFLLIAPYLLGEIVRWIGVMKNQPVNDLAQIQERIIHFTQISLLMFAGSLLNPNGWQLWQLPFTTVSRQAEQLFIAEWQSPDFHDPYMLPFGIMLFLVVAIFGVSEKRADFYEILLISGFGLLGLISVRNIFFFVIVAAPVVGRYGTIAFSDLGKKTGSFIVLNFETKSQGFNRILNLVLVFIVGIIVILRIAIYLPYDNNLQQLEEIYPVSAVEFVVENKPNGRLFNSYNFGGYLIWSLPEYPVFVDGRADLHQDEIILTWYRVINGGEEWEQVFWDWEIGYVLVEPNVPLLRDLAYAGWSVVYQDKVAVVAFPPAE